MDQAAPFADLMVEELFSSPTPFSSSEAKIRLWLLETFDISEWDGELLKVQTEVIRSRGKLFFNAAAWDAAPKLKGKSKKFLAALLPLPFPSIKFHQPATKQKEEVSEPPPKPKFEFSDKYQQLRYAVQELNSFFKNQTPIAMSPRDIKIWTEKNTEVQFPFTFRDFTIALRNSPQPNITRVKNNYLNLSAKIAWNNGASITDLLLAPFP